MLVTKTYEQLKFSVLCFNCGYSLDCKDALERLEDHAFGLPSGDVSEF